MFVSRPAGGWESRIAARLRALPPLVVDFAIALLVLIGQSVPFFFAQRQSGPEPWTMAEYLPVLLGVVPLLVRRRYPLTVLILTVASAAIYSLRDPDIPPQPIWYGWLIALYTVASLSPRWTRMLAILLSTAPALSVSPGTFIRGALTALGAYALGRSAVHYRERAALMEERAAERERARIARDMHDILAHGISIMIVQAEAGPLAVRTAPERAEKAFEAIGAAGRDAQAQLRRMLNLLKDEAEGPRAPQPTLAGLAGLVERVSAAGPQVRLAVAGTPSHLPADAEVAVYRIVQEALTNMVKHAQAAHGLVSLDWKDDELVITVSDDGRGAPAGLEGGHGLVGMRERAAAYGGTVATTPDAAGFEVVVRLPIGEMS
ncbi:sensor histidine kinase [Nonomuraea typhae]|uniref:sensor histidine kinase n=1 Tax=Nonomuraea typhae TaxID=2603600 RepID=UPI0012F7EF49|nr:histidine kinase [Nonomuraea typhae]